MINALVNLSNQLGNGASDSFAELSNAQPTRLFVNMGTNSSAIAGSKIEAGP